MKILTSRFGEVEVDLQAVINVAGGLIGFPDQKRYVIIRHKPESPFFWFQSTDRPELAFVIVDPLLFKPDYEVPLPELVLDELGAAGLEEIGVYVIVTIPPGRPQDMTANLLGPLVVNTKSRLARQLVLDEKAYSYQHPILTPGDEGSNPQTRRKTTSKK